MHTLFSLLEPIFPPHLLNRVLLVGGCVRDWLTGKEPKDLDLAGFLTSGELQGLGFRPLTPVSSHPVHFLHRDGLGIVEFTPLTGEAELLEDLWRRDFTVNAMAMGKDSSLLDPTGGRRDLEQRLLRPCTAHSFDDDPLRIFRGFRFETDGWRLTEDALALIQSRHWEDELARLPMERFSGEMMRALAGADPARFFRRMLELKVGTAFLPELFRMGTVPAGPLQHHPEGDLLTHSLQTLEKMVAMTPEPLPRFCALFHDLGKLATPAAEHPRHIGHEKTGSGMAGPFCRRLRLSAAWRRALSAACRLHLTAGRWHQLRPSTRLSLTERAVRGGIEGFLPLLVEADRGETLPHEEWRQALEAAASSPTDAGIDPALLSGPASLPPQARAALVRQGKIRLLMQKSRQRSLPASGVADAEMV